MDLNMVRRKASGELLFAPTVGLPSLPMPAIVQAKGMGLYGTGGLGWDGFWKGWHLSLRSTISLASPMPAIL